MDIKSNIWKYYLIKFLSDFWIVAPVFVPFFTSVGLSVTQIFILESVYSIAAVVLNIPAGYFSDIVGRKKAIILSSFLFTFGMFFFAFSSSFYLFLLAELIMGFGSGLKAGSYPALVYDTLVQLKKKLEYKKIEGKATLYLRIGTAVSSISGGLLAAINLRYAFYANSLTFLFLLFVSFLIIEPERKKLAIAKSHLNELFKISKYVFLHPKIRYIILYSSLLIASVPIGIWLYYFYYQKLGIDVAYYGFLLAIIGFLSGLGSKYAYSIENRIGKKMSFILPLFSFTIVYFSLGFISNLAMLAAVFFNGLVAGIMTPLIYTYINLLVKSEIRATVLSILEMSGSLLFSIVSPLIGKIADVYSLNMAFVSLSIFVFVFGIISLFLLRKNKII